VSSNNLQTPSKTIELFNITQNLALSIYNLGGAFLNQAFTLSSGDLVYPFSKFYSDRIVIICNRFDTLPKDRYSISKGQ
jgi:hypothetical protein